MRPDDVVSSYLEAVCVATLSVFAFAVWPPLTLLVVGLFAGLAAWQMGRRP